MPTANNSKVLHFCILYFVYILVQPGNKKSFLPVSPPTIFFNLILKLPSKMLPGLLPNVEFPGEKRFIFSIHRKLISIFNKG